MDFFCFQLLVAVHQLLQQTAELWGIRTIMKTTLQWSVDQDFTYRDLIYCPVPGMESGWEIWMTVLFVLVSNLCHPISLIEPSFESAQISYIVGVVSKWNRNFH